MPDVAQAQREVAGTPEFVLNVRGLTKHFPIREGLLQRVTGQVRAVDGVSFDLRRGETVGLVGESGCGKTTLGRCIAGLITPTSGGVYFGLDENRRQRLDDLLASGTMRTPDEERELDELTKRFRVDALVKPYQQHYRKNCQMVFQDSFASLNPRHLVRDLVGRPLRIHHRASRSELTQRVIELLEEVGLGREHLYRYPHQFSGGQRQRISIARALALEPDLVVLDEPTSSLDVSVQAQILNLLHQLQQERGLTYLFISHDLNVVRHVSDRLVVMYLGETCEVGPSDQLFDSPKHPYTEALIAANPGLDDERSHVRLYGDIPSPANPPEGCRFHTRCPRATPECGWDIDDALRALERNELLDGLVGVERASPFSAVFDFESGAAAQAVHEALESPPTPQAMRDAMIELEPSDTRLQVSFVPVDGVELVAIDDDRETACILFTKRRTEPV